MRVTVLGTGTSQGIPVIGCQCEVCQSDDHRDKRLRVSAYVSLTDLNLLIDIGPDFRTQMLSNDLNDVDAVFITHEHNDHTAGLDDIRPINFLHRKSIPVYAEHRVAEELKRRFHYAFGSDKYPGAPVIQMIPIGPEAFEINADSINPIRIMHGSLPILGLRMQNFAYLTDVKSIDKSELDKLKEIDVLILSALRHESHHSHLSLNEALALALRIGAKRTYLTHLSHHMGKHAEVEKLLPPNVHLAFDGLIIDC